MAIANRGSTWGSCCPRSPASTHDELKRRAELAGMSLQAYVAQLLERSTETPSLDEWLPGLDDLTAHRDVSGAKVVRAVFDELP